MWRLLRRNPKNHRGRPMLIATTPKVPQSGMVPKALTGGAMTLRLKLISHAPDRDQAGGIGWGALELLAQPPHVDGNRARIDILRAAPDPVEKLLTGEYLLGMPRQQI